MTKTERHEAVASFINRHTYVYISPTYKEIAAAVGAGIGTVYGDVKILEEQGRVRRMSFNGRLVFVPPLFRPTPLARWMVHQWGVGL